MNIKLLDIILHYSGEDNDPLEQRLLNAANELFNRDLTISDLVTIYDAYGLEFRVDVVPTPDKFREANLLYTLFKYGGADIISVFTQPISGPAAKIPGIYLGKFNTKDVLIKVFKYQVL